MTTVIAEQYWIDCVVKSIWLRRTESGTNVYNTEMDKQARRWTQENGHSMTVTGGVISHELDCPNYVMQSS
jgi:hypothetical protein